MADAAVLGFRRMFAAWTANSVLRTYDSIPPAVQRSSKSIQDQEEIRPIFLRIERIERACMKGRWQAASYFGSLLFFNCMGDPTGLISLPLLFMLKDRLHLGPEAVAVFEAVTLVPAYGAVLFGLLRDRCSPFGLRDRGYFAIAAPAAVVCYMWLAAVPMSYSHMVIGILGAMIAYQMLDAATSALITVVAQRETATGRLSALTETMETIVSMLSVLAGGWMVGHMKPETMFLLAGGLTLPIIVHAFWRPAAAFPEDPPLESDENLKSFGALFRKLIPQGRKLKIVMLILLLYNFSPGWGTPLFYYLTDTVHLSSEAFGICRAAQFGSVLLATALYSVLCRRLRFRHLIKLAMAVNILPGFFYLLVRGTVGAVAASAVVGFLSGFATVGIFDLLMRYCPKGLEGFGTALGHSAFGLAGAFGDVVSAAVYARGGFAVCLAMDAAATALILPALGKLPEDSMPTLDPVQDAVPVSF